jgi:hypothetical protein
VPPIAALPYASLKEKPFGRPASARSFFALARSCFGPISFVSASVEPPSPIGMNVAGRIAWPPIRPLMIPS